MQDITVVSSREGVLVALAGAAGVVLYSLQKNDTTPGLSAWEMSQRRRLCHMWPACAVSMSADGSTLAAAALGGQLCVWDLQSGLDAVRLELQVPAFRQPLSSLCVIGVLHHQAHISAFHCVNCIRQQAHSDCL